MEKSAQFYYQKEYHPAYDDHFISEIAMQLRKKKKNEIIHTKRIILSEPKEEPKGIYIYNKLIPIQEPLLTQFKVAIGLLSSGSNITRQEKVAILHHISNLAEENDKPTQQAIASSDLLNLCTDLIISPDVDLSKYALCICNSMCEEEYIIPTLKIKITNNVFEILNSHEQNQFRVAILLILNLIIVVDNNIKIPEKLWSELIEFKKSDIVESNALKSVVMLLSYLSKERWNPVIYKFNDLMYNALIRYPNEDILYEVLEEIYNSTNNAQLVEDIIIFTNKIFIEKLLTLTLNDDYRISTKSLCILGNLCYFDKVGDIILHDEYIKVVLIIIQKLSEDSPVQNKNILWFVANCIMDSNNVEQILKYQVLDKILKHSSKFDDILKNEFAYILCNCICYATNLQIKELFKIGITSMLVDTLLRTSTSSFINCLLNNINILLDADKEKTSEFLQDKTVNNRLQSLYLSVNSHISEIANTILGKLDVKSNMID